MARRRPGASGHRADALLLRLGRAPRQRRRDRADSPSRSRTGRIVEGEAIRRVAAGTDPHASRSPCVHEDRAIAVLTREWSNLAGRQPGELERTYLSLFERFADDDRRGHVPVRGPSRLDQHRPPRRRRCDRARRGRPRPVRLAERGVGAASRRHHRQRHRAAPRRARLQRRSGALRLRAPRAGDRGVRADARTSPC